MPTVSHASVMTSQVCTRDTMISMAVMIERACIVLTHQQKDSSGALKWGKQTPIAVLHAPQPDCRESTSLGAQLVPESNRREQVDLCILVESPRKVF